MRGFFHSSNKPQTWPMTVPIDCWASCTQCHQRRPKSPPFVSAAAFSLGHGANDAQKTMGLILALLIATNKVGPEADVPLWVVLSAHFAIALGTMFGGWRIVKTMGTKLTRIQPMGGFAAETAAALTLFFTSAKGISVSTTHTITGAIVGVGSVNRLSAVRWGVARRVLWAWIFTIPGAALVAAGAYAVVAFVS